MNQQSGYAFARSGHRRPLATSDLRFEREGGFAMAVSSMTGFARAAGSSGAWRWTFELKTVNAKGLDIRLRMPGPFDRVETEARRRLAKALARGTCFANLSVQRAGATGTARIDLAALESIAVAAS